MCSGRVTDRIGNADSSKELGVEKIQCLWEGTPQQDMSEQPLQWLGRLEEGHRE